ncbi:response regulator transcription factor [Thalassotalea sp. M1531]|uniref:Response regulator transcription factor n=1 Tax=Thalassotalea algicola TaxID=2716224 RepID=A0A7Y0Q6V1_9GAMM|nr:response regulator transcription factor [Thalassotalea algicola]NMP31217.1 response regulator transcription factor [Thalassotalea algicola]
MRLLLIEDDMALHENLKLSLVEQGYSVDSAFDGEEGLYLGSEHPYDAAVIDVGLPKRDGISVITELRTLDIKFPVLILTARDRWQDKVQGLDAGADDYLTKPFQQEELHARLNALIRRSAGQASPVMTQGELSINTASHQVTVAGKAVALSSYEYRLIAYLMLHLGEVVSKTTLTEHLYDQDFDLDSNVIEVFIRRLRKKLDPESKYQFIETLRGQGYRLKHD